LLLVRWFLQVCGRISGGKQHQVTWHPLWQHLAQQAPAAVLQHPAALAARQLQEQAQAAAYQLQQQHLALE
jgi:hypothetical protein